MFLSPVLAFKIPSNSGSYSCYIIYVSGGRQKLLLIVTIMSPLNSSPQNSVCCVKLNFENLVIFLGFFSPIRLKDWTEICQILKLFKNNASIEFPTLKLVYIYTHGCLFRFLFFFGGGGPLGPFSPFWGRNGGLGRFPKLSRGGIGVIFLHTHLIIINQKRKQPILSTVTGPSEMTQLGDIRLT